MLEAVVPKPVRAEPVRRLPYAGEQLRLSPNLRWQLTLAAVDLLTVFLAAILAYTIYVVSGVGRSHYDPLSYLRLGVIFSTITVFALHGYGAYRDEFGLLRIDATLKVLRAALAGVLLTLALSFLARLPSFSRITLLLVGLATIVALVVQRSLVWRLRDAKSATRPVLIFGAGETGRLLARQLLHEHHFGITPVGFLDDDARLAGSEVRVGSGVGGESLPVFGSERELEQAVQLTGAAAVFLATPSAPTERINELIRRVEGLELSALFVPSAGDLLLSSLRFGQVAGIPVFTRRTPVRSRFYPVIKRAIDVAGACLLLLLSGPALALGALLVRLTSAGPVFFTQTRVGLGGAEFTIFKLRTMHVEAPRYGPHPSSTGDPRVTAVGRWLRRLSIDEIPQLFNVLRGEMSLVGPRPEMPFVVDVYNDTQRQRLAVKPGLTGLWQISADRAFEIHSNIHYDLYYVEHGSTTLDVAILLLTPFALVAKNRAL